MPDECIFCAIVAGEMPAQVVDSDEHTVAFMDINPATPGHALVVPRTHAANLLDVSDRDLERTMAAARRLARRIAAALEPAGFNILNACGEEAWQTVFHYHLHVIPRYAGDPLELPWIPRGAPHEEIEAAAERIRAA
ncbi:MAG TPA: HIT domain-containing protein [Solirubrobacterales bacterium]|nr:HIT domain-containing protein [Solirubrobacterales bacterium]